MCALTQSGSKAPPGSLATLPLCSFELPDAAMVASTPFGVRSPPCPKARRGSVKYCAVSRVTPDKFLARIAAHMPTMDAAFDNQAWVVKIDLASQCLRRAAQGEEARCTARALGRGCEARRG